MSNFSTHSISHFGCLVEVLNAKDVLLDQHLVENKNSIDAMTKEDLLDAYFSKISIEDKLKLYKIYEDDFGAFGYKA